MMKEYDEIKARISRGWNTWNTRSVLSHVHLPEGVAFNLGIKEYKTGDHLSESLIGRQGENDEHIHPFPRTYDGKYTRLNLNWHGVEVKVESGTDGDDLYILVTPLSKHRIAPALTVEASILWNRPGTVQRDNNELIAITPGGKIQAFSSSVTVYDPYIRASGPYLVLPLNEAVGISTGKQRTLQEIETILALRRAECEAYSEQFGDLQEVYEAMQTCLAWDTIYEPLKDRVVSPVSRIWSVVSGGYVLFCWDTYFAAYMAALDNKDLAYCNAIEITREKTADGFVPNYAWGCGIKSNDRSQPPVGSLVVRELYRRFGDRWLLEELYDDLYTWNQWWLMHRVNETTGLMAWGSDPYEPCAGNEWELNGVNERFGAALESGLDNSPMYDDIPFDTQAHQLLLADAGLNGLYSMDCCALADIADILERKDEADELRATSAEFDDKMQRLWNREAGIFMNMRTDTGEFSPHLSPTNFYPLLSRTATLEQAQRMVKEHFYNPEEFWGDYIMPSIARNDPGYPDQDYWRGRIWAPMNLLVYLGLANYDLNGARNDITQKSRELLLKEWREHGHVHENYSGDTGEGCNKPNSDAFYHWGGLLGLISFIDQGYFDNMIMKR